MTTVWWTRYTTYGKGWFNLPITSLPRLYPCLPWTKSRHENYRCIGSESRITFYPIYQIETQQGLLMWCLSRTSRTEKRVIDLYMPSLLECSRLLGRVFECHIIWNFSWDMAFPQLTNFTISVKRDCSQGVPLQNAMIGREYNVMHLYSPNCSLHR